METKVCLQGGVQSQSLAISLRQRSGQSQNEMAALQSLQEDQFLFSSLRQRHNQTSSIPKTKAAKQEESEKQTPETARPHHFLFDALQSLPEGWKTTTAISPWAVDYHLCWNKSTLRLWTQWDLRASGGDLPTRGAFNSIQKRRQSGYTNSARSNTAFGDWGWQWDNVDDLKESAIGDYQYTEFMEACIHKYIHMTFSVHSRQSVVAKRLCSKMYYASF